MAFAERDCYYLNFLCALVYLNIICCIKMAARRQLPIAKRIQTVLLDLQGLSQKNIAERIRDRQ